MRDRSEVASSLFWDVPRADTHAVEDIGAVVEWLTERCAFHADAKSSLAVLHNRNDMTNLFRASNWVSESQDSIVSRGVTTCAGMTAHTVILAQTRVGFLTGGRKKSFLALPEDEQMVQLEEAYARATVAITRARALCLIVGPREWTTRAIFLLPKGDWPRQGHPKALISPYDQRSVPMLTCAQPCFEQGSLPSLLALPGEASLLVLLAMACSKRNGLSVASVGR